MQLTVTVDSSIGSDRMWDISSVLCHQTQVHQLTIFTQTWRQKQTGDENTFTIN